MVSDKTEMIRIRCTPETKREWDVLKAKLQKNGEDTLKYLMSLHRLYEKVGLQLV